MIADFEIIANGRTRYEGQTERRDEAYDRNRRALVALIEDLEAKLATSETALHKARVTAWQLVEKLATSQESLEKFQSAAAEIGLREAQLKQKLEVMTQERNRSERALAIAAEVDDMLKSTFHRTDVEPAKAIIRRAERRLETRLAEIASEDVAKESRKAALRACE